MVIFLTSQKEWIRSEWLSHSKIVSFTECYNCREHIYNHRKGLKIHVNIQQKPQKKYFCSKSCKNEFSYLK